MDTKSLTPFSLPTMKLQQHPSGFRFDKTKDGWELVENIALEGEPNLILDNFLEEGESSLYGPTMLEIAKKNVGEKGALAGQLHAERMLEQIENIPDEWQEFYAYLMFAGTVWRDKRGFLIVTCLLRLDGTWQIGWDGLGSNFDHRSCLVRIEK